MPDSDVTTGEAILEALISPNVSDSNMEPANIVDALDKIGDALWAIAKALQEKQP